MATPPSAKEVSVDLAGFKSNVDQQFKNVDQKIDWAKDAIDERLNLILKAIAALFTVIPLIVGGGFLLRNDLGDVKVELGKIGEKVSALRDDLSRIRTAQVSDPQAIAIQSQINSTLRRIEDKLNASSSITLALSEDEKNLVRLFLKLNSGPSKGPPKYSVGDVITVAKELPDELVSKVSKLKGLRFALDPSNGSALLVATDNRIVAIVEPA